MMFAGIIFIASFGAAGILSAIAASSPGNDIEVNAVNYLIATSVSYVLIVVDTTSKVHSP